MIIMFKVVVAAAGTPGPLLGDGTNTTATLLLPATAAAGGNSIKTQNDGLGSYSEIFNLSGSRVPFRASKLKPVGMPENGGRMFVGAKDSAKTAMIPLTAGAGFEFGWGGTDTIDMSQLDVDADTNGEGLIIVAEIL